MLIKRVKVFSASMLHTFIVPSDDTSAAALTLSPLIGRRCQLRGLAISGMTHSLAPDVPIDVPETFAKPTTSVPYRTNRTFPVPVAGATSATWDTESYAKKKHGLAVSIGSLLRHRDGGSAPVSQKSPGSFDRDVKSRLSAAFDRHDAERSLSRSDAGRQLAVFEGLPRLHCPGDDQLDIQHGNFAVCLQCGPVANSGLGYGKLG